MSDAPHDPDARSPRDLRLGGNEPGPSQPPASTVDPLLEAVKRVDLPPDHPLRKMNLEDLVKNFRLRDRLWKGGPPWATLVLLAANIGIFVWMVLPAGMAPRIQGLPPSGVGWWSPTGESLVAWGANYGPFARGEEPWRLFTAMFLHIGVLHLAMNVWALWAIGRLTERMFGTTGMLAMYFVTGLAGSLASVAWHDEDVAAGASGGIFGLLGGVFGATLRGWNDFPSEWKARLWTGAWRSALLMAVLTYYVSFIDNAAHLGGLLSGMLFGALLPRPMAPALPRFRALQGLAWGVVGLAAVGLAWAKLPPMFAPRYELVRFAEADEALRQERLGWEERKGVDAQALARIRDVQTPLWTKLEADWARCEAARPAAEGLAARKRRLKWELPAVLHETAAAVRTALDRSAAAAQKPSLQAQREENAAWAEAVALRQRAADYFGDLAKEAKEK